MTSMTVAVSDARAWSSAGPYSAGSSTLGVYTYTPPGDNVYVNYSLPLNANLLADISTGNDVSLYFYAADNQIGYLFNARSFSANHPQFTITAAAIPEPAATTLMAMSLGPLLAGVSRKKSK